MTMWWAWLAGGVIAACGALTAWVLIRTVRRVFDLVRFERARAAFRLRREWLEVGFARALESGERVRWEDARWRDGIVWARDRRTHRLLALVGVDFEPSGFDIASPHHATAIFEFRHGRWHAEGVRLDDVQPQEAVRQLLRFEPVSPDSKA